MSCSVYFLIGIPGSGKTEYAKLLHDTTGARVFSLSETRELWNAKVGRGNYRPCDMVNDFYSQIQACLTNGDDCVVDATNLKGRNRKRFVYNILRGIECRKIACVVASPFLYCAEHCYYGISVAREGYRSWQTPGIWEGWNEIWLYYKNPEWITLNGTISSFLKRFDGYDQKNSHHGLTLGQHLRKTMEAVDLSKVKLWKTEMILDAALLHDCGKPLTRRIGKGGFATYHDHQNIGAYEALFFDYQSNVDVSYISALICHHMDPISWNERTNISKYKCFYGEEFYNDMMLIHEADRTAR